jgi:protein gp37
MGDRTGIAWTEATWNPLRGCSRVSEGCRFCYAEKLAARFSGSGHAYEGLAHVTASGQARWTGTVVLVEKHLDDPLRWTRPRRVFVNSMSDVFHEAVPDEWIDKIMARIVLADGRGRWAGHLYQVLTKRAERMHAYMTDPDTPYRVGVQRCKVVVGFTPHRGGLDWTHGAEAWPPTRLHLGISAEDQASADDRIPWLLRTPAAVRWLSAEPLLGPLDLEATNRLAGVHVGALGTGGVRGLDWVVAGGESGGPPERRLVVESCEDHRWFWRPKPHALEWARALRDQCQAAGVPFFFKQWGGPAPKSGDDVLDGRRWQEYPEARHVRP